MFVDQMGVEMLRKNLYKNFLLHLSHLIDNDLITTAIFMKIIDKLQRLIVGEKSPLEILQDDHKNQAEQWKAVGRAKHQQQLLVQKTVVESKVCGKDVAHSSGIKTKEDKSAKKESGSGSKPSRILPNRKDPASCATKSAAISGLAHTRRTLLLADIESKRRLLTLRSMH